MFFTDKLLDINLIGGKAYKLLKLGIKNTPKLFVLKTSFFEEDKSKEELTFEIEKVFSSKKLYAIRSSATLEDGSNYSFAGIFDSFLNIKKDEIYDYIMKVYQSKDSNRVKKYCQKNNISHDSIKMAVIVEEMVKADFSGVINTINPITNNPDEICISVTNGYGDNLLSGKIDGSSYLINGDKITVTGKDILSKRKIELVKRLAYDVVSKTNGFQDIEFAIKGNKIYFLQTRDITTYNKFLNKKRTLTLDNSNIIESYYGNTSYLTYSFANSVYSKVYESTLKFVNVREGIIKSLKSTLDNMLYYYDGKIYYNLNNWYYLTSIFQIGSSKDYMENMMGLKTTISDTKRIKMNIFDIVRFGFNALKRLKTLDKLISDFEKEFDEIVMPYYGKRLDGSVEELINLYKRLEERIVSKFSIPIANDCAVMIYYGMLVKRISRINIPLKNEIIAQAINNDGNVRSADMYYRIEDITTYIKGNESIYNDFLNLDYLEIYNKYHHEDSKLKCLIDEYIKDFGSRVCDELKLETITLIEDNSLAYDLIKKSLISNRIKAENSNKIVIPKRIKKIADKTKHYIKNRERLRLKRTYVFSVVRNIFLAIGRKYELEDKIENERDIFYLTVNELFNQDLDFKQIVSKRKRQFNNFSNEYFDRLVFYQDEVLPILKANNDLKQGIASGGGIVSGVVSVLNDPSEYFKPNTILVTKRTDSGWISLFPLIRGLIVEHGSMLSHSFVVARELGIPAIVGVKGVTKILKTGDYIKLDGNKGVYELENKKIL